MGKKVLVLGVLAALGGLSALGSLPARAASPFDGAYVGGNLGYQNWNDNFNDHAGDSANGAGGSGGSLGLDLGYGMTQGNLYLGGELDGDASDNRASMTDPAIGRTRVENNKQASVSLLPGVVLGNNAALVFGRVGYAIGDEKVDSQTGGDSSKTVQGAVLGLGTAVPVAQNIDARVDVDHTWYNKSDISGTSVTPQEDEVKLGVDYHF